MPNKETAKSELLATLDAADGSGARPYLSAAMDTFLHLLDSVHCDTCGGSTADNPLSMTVYCDWSSDPHQAFCYHCAAECPQFQQQPPGEFPGADPRYWWLGHTPDAILGRYHSANFWLMVTTRRAAETTQPADSPNETETRRRLDSAAHFLATGDYATARFIIEPIGKPGYYDFGIEPRPFAFDGLNARRLRNAWEAIADHAAAELARLLEAHPHPNRAALDARRAEWAAAAKSM